MDEEKEKSTNNNNTASSFHQVVAQTEMELENIGLKTDEELAAVEGEEKETDKQSRRSVLQKHAVERTKLQRVVHQLKLRRKKLRKGEKDQKKKLSRRIKELLANMKKRQSADLQTMGLSVRGLENEDVVVVGVGGSGCEKLMTTAGMVEEGEEDGEWVNEEEEIEKAVKEIEAAGQKNNNIPGNARKANRREAVKQRKIAAKMAKRITREQQEHHDDLVVVVAGHETQTNGHTTTTGTTTTTTTVSTTAAATNKMTLDDKMMDEEVSL
eukprot:GHVS01082208.1.p1 GENE.GHVS01082208.1~~GHVS01082208.1.p1  ORF type:complete len:307 (-),score=115.94 GHVS01082208.1:85-891(-)